MRVGLLLVLALTAAGCGGGGSGSAASTHPTRGGPRPRVFVVGPLGTHWPRLHLAAGTVIADDGRVLWAYAPDGTRRAVWRHAGLGGPPGVAVAPGGRRLAYVVNGPRSVSTVFDLRPDGRVVFAGKGPVWPPPVFLRSPIAPRDPVRLFYTLQSLSGFGGTLKVETHDGARRVPVRIYRGEWPAMVTGYPGTVNAALTLLRRIQFPTINETVLDEDSPRSPGGAWQTFATLAQSDGFEYPAWLSPGHVMIGSDRGGMTTETLWKLCGPDSSRTVARFAPDRDPSDGAVSGETLPLDEWHVLLLTAAHPDVWSSLDVRTGAITPTAIRYRFIGWAVVPRAVVNGCAQ